MSKQSLVYQKITTLIKAFFFGLLGGIAFVGYLFIKKNKSKIKIDKIEESVASGVDSKSLVENVDDHNERLIDQLPDSIVEDAPLPHVVSDHNKRIGYRTIKERAEKYSRRRS